MSITISKGLADTKRLDFLGKNKYDVLCYNDGTFRIVDTSELEENRTVNVYDKSLRKAIDKAIKAKAKLK